MRNSRILLLIVLAWFLSGCAASIKYPVDKNVYKREVPLNYRTVVDIFKDTRPVEESDGSLHKINGIEVTPTKNKDFKPSMDTQISLMLADHFNKANIFKITEVRDIDDNLDTNQQEMEKLKAEGIDLAILAKMKHFYGYQSFSAAAGIAPLFGLAGVLTEAIANPKTVGGKVEYGDVKVIDLGKQGILWQGNIEHSFDEKDVFYDGQIIYCLRALKEANNKFAKKMVEVVPER